MTVAPPDPHHGPPPLISADTPGVYQITADRYHRDPVEGGSLSASGAKRLMPPGCPALFKAWRDGEAETRSHALDFGRAAHRVALDAGEDYAVVPGSGKDPNAWRTKDDIAAVAAVRAAGSTPITPADAETITAMAAELRRHPVAAALLDPAAGQPEQALIWRDRESGVNCRALVDFLRHPTPGRPYVIADYKTAAAVDPESFSKALWTYGYYGQAAWYSDGAAACGLAAPDDIAFVLIFQLKTPPYLVVCAQVVPDTVQRGHMRNRKARDLYRWCTEHDQWPGYQANGIWTDNAVIPVQLPHYATYQLDAMEQLGELAPEGSHRRAAAARAATNTTRSRA